MWASIVSFIFLIMLLFNTSPSIGRPVDGSIERASEDWLPRVTIGAVVALLLILVVVAVCSCCKKKEKKQETIPEKQPKEDAKQAGTTNGSLILGKKEPEAKEVVEPAAATDPKVDTYSKKKPVPVPVGTPPSPSKKASKELKATTGKKTPSLQAKSVARSKSTSAGSSDTLKGYPESPDEKKEMTHSKDKKDAASSSKKDQKASSTLNMQTSMHTAREMV